MVKLNGSMPAAAPFLPGLTETPAQPPMPQKTPNAAPVDEYSKVTTTRFDELAAKDPDGKYKSLGINPSKIETVAWTDDQLNARADATSGRTVDMDRIDQVKKSYEAARDALDVGAKPTASAMTKLEMAAENLETNSRYRAGKLAGIEREMQGLAKGLAAGNADPRTVDTLKSLATRAQELQAENAKVMEMAKDLRQVAHKAGVGAEKLEKLGETLAETKKLSTVAGKALFGLDVAANYAEYQKNDPQNGEKNLLKAITASGSKLQFDLLTSGTKLNAAETGAGVIKFGLEAMGMKDTGTYKTVDAISQAMPVDVVSKGFAQMVDQTHAWGKFCQTGSVKDLEALNKANLNGKNGLVMQGAAMIGDLVANNGENIPTTTGKTCPEKLTLVKGLLNGGSSEDRATQIRNIIGSATPEQLGAMLPELDRSKLVSSMVQDTRRSINPVAGLVLDVCNKAEAAGSPRVEGKLYHEAAELVQEAKGQGRTQAINQLKGYVERGTLNEAPQGLRNLIVHD